MTYMTFCYTLTTLFASCQSFERGSEVWLEQIIKLDLMGILQVEAGAALFSQLTSYDPKIPLSGFRRSKNQASQEAAVRNVGNHEM